VIAAAVLSNLTHSSAPSSNLSYPPDTYYASNPTATPGATPNQNLTAVSSQVTPAADGDHRPGIQRRPLPGGHRS